MLADLGDAAVRPCGVQDLTAQHDERDLFDGP